MQHASFRLERPKVSMQSFLYFGPSGEHCCYTVSKKDRLWRCFIEICNFWTLCFHLKATEPNESNSSMIHLMGVDIVLQKLPYSINSGMLVTNLFKSCLESVLSLRK